MKQTDTVKTMMRRLIAILVVGAFSDRTAAVSVR